MGRTVVHSRPKQSMPKQFYVAFYKPSLWDLLRHPFDLLICLFTWSRYSHVEVVIGSENKWTDLKWYSSSPRDGGVRCRQMAPRPGAWRIVHIPWINGQDAEWAEHWFRSRAGTQYDWLGALTCLFGGFLNHTRRWFCSEAVVEVLRALHSYPLGGRKSYTISPARLHNALLTWASCKDGCQTHVLTTREVGG